MRPDQNQWSEILRQRGILFAIAIFQACVAFASFGLIAAGSPPRWMVQLASGISAFSIGDFSTSYLIMGAIIHIALIIFFGIRFWSLALGLAAQLAAILVFAGIGIQAIIEVAVLAFHHFHLDRWGLLETYFTYSEGGDALFAITILQQPFKVAIVLPSALACLVAIQNVITVIRLENVAVLHLHTASGVVLCACFFFARVFNHVAHVVAPTTAQVLNEERFAPQLRTELIQGFRVFFLAEANLHHANTMLNRLGRTACGVLLLSIEHIPLWSSEIVDLLLEGREP